MQTYPMLEHFVELKSRLLTVFFVFIISFIMCYYFSEDIYRALLQPLVSVQRPEVQKMIYTGLAEVFFTYLKLAAVSAFVIVLPVIAWQLYLFVSPGLHKIEKPIAAYILVMSPLLFYIGGAFVFYGVMPGAFHFFLSFENPSANVPVILAAKISEYLNLVIQLIVAFGLAFQLPIVLLVLNLCKIITPASLKRQRRIAIVVNFIIAGILTPPDVVSQFVLAIPLLLLYEGSILMCKFMTKRQQDARYQVD